MNDVSQSGPKMIHWAEMTADRIIRQLGDKDSYVCASGITPSGVVHFGNFRETITVDFVVRALRERGKKVRFIFSWDDFDTFRKVPVNMPKQEELKKYLFQPIVDTPDPYGEHESYAAHHEAKFMEQLKKVGVAPDPIFQAKKYRAGTYREQIRQTLQNKDKIADILNQHRKEPLPADWLPISIYCEKCNRDDKVEKITYDGKDTLHYRCEHEGCGQESAQNLNTSTRVKLPWRMDWPMRWAFEQVDFEPGGKDHSSEGGSYTTAKEIVALYNWRSPVYLQYDFVSIKGSGGKMSSSKGDLVTVNDVLAIYEPEMLRWIFASYKPNVDFSISFDLDVIKTYEDFDRMERLALGVETGNEKNVAMAKRVYELSQLDGKVPAQCPVQPSFRHLCNILQVHDGKIHKAQEEYAGEIKNARDQRRFQERSERALFWLENHAPEDFKFKINSVAPTLSPTEAEGKFLAQLKADLKNSELWSTEEKLSDKIYAVMHQFELQPAQAFTLLYQILISKPKGPKLANFLIQIGQERVLGLLS